MSIVRSLILAALLLANGLPANAQDVPATAREVSIATEAAVPMGRLTDLAHPTAYRLDLTVDAAQTRFSGRVEIDAVLARPSDYVDLHGRGLAIRAVRASVAGEKFPVRWAQKSETGLSRIYFGRMVPAGPLTLSFEYDAEFNDGPSGLFRVQVDGQWYSWSQFQSIDARAAFPSFDQPSFKTPFRVTIRTPPGLMAVSNAPLESAVEESGMTVHRFAPTLPLPTYLIAIMTGPFVAVSDEVPPTPQRAAALPLRIVSTRPNSAGLGTALDGSAEIVRLLEDYFGDAFPFPKLDQITSPIMPGAMENAGADLYRDNLIVLDEAAPTWQLRKFGMVVAHELGHQWFGDLVTPGWWDDIWLNESFANWIGYRIGDAWRPELNIKAGALAEGFAAMNTDELVAGRPIRQLIETDAQIDSAFDSITYGKGGHVIAMFASFMGEDRFRDGVRRYLASHRFGSATSADFFAALAGSAGDERIVDAMRSFVDQQGVPLIYFQRNGQNITVSQQPYAALGVDPTDRKWGVPVCVRGTGERTCHLLTAASMTFAVRTSKLLVPNAGGTGYYRFELPENQWNALIAQAANLTGEEALATVDSLAASIRAGRSQISQLARLARKLKNHEDSYAAEAAVDAMSDFIGTGFIEKQGHSGWRRFRQKLYLPLLRQYGFDPRQGAYAQEPPERSHRRSQIVRRLSGMNKARNLNRSLASATASYLAGDRAALDASWFGPAFDLHIRLGDTASARMLVQRAIASEDPLFRPAALSAAAYSGKLDIAKWLLEELDDPRLRSSEKNALLQGIMSRTATREYGFGWMLDNLDALMSGGSGIFFSSRLPAFLSSFCSVERSERLAKELRPRFAGTPAELQLERTTEKIRNCGKLGEQRGMDISQAFEALR